MKRWRARFLSSVAWPVMMYHQPMTALSFQRIVTMSAKALGVKTE
jgi:hypothetical protein